jgi:hypothetical protein
MTVISTKATATTTATAMTTVLMGKADEVCSLSTRNGKNTISIQLIIEILAVQCAAATHEGVTMHGLRLGYTEKEHRKAQACMQPQAKGGFFFTKGVILSI